MAIKGRNVFGRDEEDCLRCWTCFAVFDDDAKTAAVHAPICKLAHATERIADVLEKNRSDVETEHEMKHTPTPYRYEIYNVGSVKRARLIEEKTSDSFAEGLFVDDAAFIVEACNAYEKHVQQIRHLDSAVRAQALVIERLNKERDGLKEAVDKAVNRLYEILNTHGLDIEGKTAGRFCRCATTLNKKAIALCEGGAETAPIKRTYTGITS